jgi:hypothetical protein
MNYPSVPPICLHGVYRGFSCTFIIADHSFHGNEKLLSAQQGARINQSIQYLGYGLDS